MQIIERPIAKSMGLTKYFTGRPCVNGHLAERYVQSGTCQECINGAMKKAREDFANDPLTIARVAAYATAARVQTESYVIRVRAPVAQLESIQSLCAAMLIARIPGADVPGLAVAAKPSDHAGATAMVSLRVHKDDEITVRSMLAHALGAL